jgi:hypothetical protein
MMATLKGGSPTAVTIEESPIEKDRDMNMEEAGGTNGKAGDASG